MSYLKMFHIVKFENYKFEYVPLALQEKIFNLSNPEPLFLQTSMQTISRFKTA